MRISRNQKIVKPADDCTKERINKMKERISNETRNETRVEMLCVE